ncbi:NAD(P)/FAD-dependent oxidoreductase [uncultured Peptoniphilus sp.]|uniref:NAD(P)/FAD-dependent oxidoreductase n=1 Tax=uncultured Peptoniphilus sp. TaxID=254354 RepID=UPI00280624F7|nr:NAD(P)/FAD-dependent oxidoreductase [uncultured Peptoniphilus sp.]
MKDIAIIGAGPAGMMAAIFASKNNNVTIFEKNEKIGKKLFITGKGRCNITNDCEKDLFFDNIVKNKKFLYSAFEYFDNKDIIKLLNENGLTTKVERGGRIFPKSDKSSDVLATLLKLLNKNNVKIVLNHTVKSISNENNKFIIDGKEFDKLVIATGGLSYPMTGSTGDGYKFAKLFGHKVTKLKSSLCGIVLNNPEESLVGLSLKNVKLIIKKNKKVIFEEIGEMMFSHFGITGPLVLSASCFINDGDKVKLSIDFKPGLDEEKLDARILRDLEENKNKLVVNSLNQLLPKAMIPIVVNKSGNQNTVVNQMTKSKRQELVKIIKNYPLDFKSLMDISTGIITQGGIDLRQINPSTLESKLVEGLYFVGEVLDLDAVTGGFNLQIAWSTGALCGKSISEDI